MPKCVKVCKIRQSIIDIGAHASNNKMKINRKLLFAGKMKKTKMFSGVENAQ